MSRIRKLGEMCSKIGSGATPRGGKEVYLHTGVAFVRSQNVLMEGFSRAGLTFISDAHAEDLSGVTVQPRDVLLNITGDSVARACLAPKELGPARVSQHVAIIRPRPDELDPAYLRYFLISPATQSHLLALASAGATRNALTKAMIENLDVPVIPLAQQREIAEVLGALDEKVELNSRMNLTLESMGQSLFRSWFVDFDPVRSKAEGRLPEGMDAETAALFPTRLADSQAGQVPAGWVTQPLDQTATFLNGLALQKYRPAEGRDSLPVIKIAQLRQGSTQGADRASADVPADYVVRDGDVLFSWSGSLLVSMWAGGEGALNQHLFKVTSSQYPKWFYFHWCRKHLPDFQRIAQAKATTMGHIQRHHLTQALAVIPPRDVLDAAGRVFEPLLERWLANAVEARTLAVLRDLLLPKLLSGEIRVRDAEAQVAASA